MGNIFAPPPRPQIPIRRRRGRPRISEIIRRQQQQQRLERQQITIWRTALSKLLQTKKPNNLVSPASFSTAVLSVPKSSMTAEAQQQFLDELWKSEKRFLRSTADNLMAPQQAAGEAQVPMEVDNQGKEEVPKEEEFDVEAILSKRKKNGTIQYLVKWVDFPNEQSTWESESSLLSNPDLHELLETFNKSWKQKQREIKLKNVPKPGPGRGWTKKRLGGKNSHKVRRQRAEESRAAAAASNGNAAPQQQQQELLQRQIS